MLEKLAAIALAGHIAEDAIGALLVILVLALAFYIVRQD